MTGALALGIAIAYLAGSFPTAYLAGRVRGIDVGASGSGNYGATNTFRNLGAGPAAIVLAVDVAKGLLPLLLVPRWLSAPGIPPITHEVLLAVAAILGHVYSVFLRFRGGKGIGTAFGAYLALATGPTLVAALVWLVIVLVARIVSLASLAAAVVLLAGVLIESAGSTDGDLPIVVLTVALVAFVFWTHRANIGRLKRGEERRIRSGRKASA